MNDFDLMQLAIEEARLGLAAGELPYGVVVADAAGRVIARTHDTVEADNDWTSHAETKAVRLAVKNHGRNLTGCTLVTTTEPCPMCLTTAWLARVSRVVFGLTMVEMHDALGGQTRELMMPAQQLADYAAAMHGDGLEVVPGVLRDACLALCREQAAAARAPLKDQMI